MPLESRKEQSNAPTDLPIDFLRMVNQVFSTNFDSGLKALDAIQKGPKFDVMGAVYLDELVLCVSVVFPNQLSATSVYASCDFDPKASSPTIQDLLGLCVDAVGALYGQLLDPSNTERIEQLASDSLAALDDVPFIWTPVEVEKRSVYLKISKANPKLDDLAEKWLQDNDPEYQERKERERKEMEALFFTGPKDKKH